MLIESTQTNYLLNQLKKGENSYQDFKHTINEYDKIAKSIVAFANQKGGQLFIGVSDEGNIIGCESQAEYHLILEIIDHFCQPKPEIECIVYEIDGKDVLEIRIAEGKQKPYASLNSKKEWIVYLRVNDICKKIGKL